MNDLDTAQADVDRLTTTLAKIDRELAGLRNQRMDVTCDRNIALRRLQELKFRAERDTQTQAVTA